ncbi:MAG: c-type cytochrome [Verrucomicrobiota bacterium]
MASCARIAAFILGMAFILSPPAGQAETGYRSPSHIIATKNGKRLFVTETTAGSVAELNATNGKLIKRLAIKSEPSGLALSPDEKKLYITAGVSNGRVLVFDTQSGKTIATYKAGHSPTAPVVSADGKTLYICNRFNNDVSVIDTASGKTRVRVAVKREPVSAVLTSDGAQLLVVNHLPAGTANSDYVAAAISVIDTKTNQTITELALPNGSNGLRDICLSPDGKYAYLGHVLARYQLPTTQIERGWVNTNAISVIDLEKMALLNTFLLDDIDLGAPNPWGIAITPDGKTLASTHAGSHEISLIDRAALHTKLAAAGDQVPNDLSFLVGMRKRVKLPGLGPRSCVIAGSRLYAAQFFTDDIAVVDLTEPDFPVVSSYSLGPTQEMNVVRRGRFLFNDGSFCFQQWQSCTSCHPSERVDALNWDILNDGIGNPKNTKSLLLSHKTPPTTVTGCRANAETSVRAGIRFFMAVLPESDAVAIDSFLKSMKPVPSPHLVNNKLSKSALRGKAVFKKAKCSKCHAGNYFTDLKLYDVGTGTGREIDTKYDVPTLVEIWRSAPYLHDGRSRTIRDVVTNHNPTDDHGYTKNLKDKEIEDLVEYVLSL